MKKFASLVIAVMFFPTIAAIAQEKVETTVSADIVSQYIWRGQDLGNVSLQPTLGVAYKNLSLTAWGNVGVSEPSDTKEIDLTLDYTLRNFNVGVTDYWTNEGADPRNRYFKYEAHGTNHVFEVNVGYDFGIASVQWYTNFAGNDGLNGNDKRAYSSYAEMSVPFHLWDVEWSASVGVVPYATDYYDSSGFAVTNISVMAQKDITITEKFSLPVFASFIANPHDQKAYLVFGITL